MITLKITAIHTGVCCFATMHINLFFLMRASVFSQQPHWFVIVVFQTKRLCRSRWELWISVQLMCLIANHCIVHVLLNDKYGKQRKHEQVLLKYDTQIYTLCTFHYGYEVKTEPSLVILYSNWNTNQVLCIFFCKKEFTYIVQYIHYANNILTDSNIWTRIQIRNAYIHVHLLSYIGDLQHITYKKQQTVDITRYNITQ